MKLELSPISLKEANQFVMELHRHYGPVVGHKYSMAVTDGSKICGVCIVGRPVARNLDDGWTLEVNRCCTDGTKNVCSKLYGASWRAAKACIIVFVLALSKAKRWCRPPKYVFIRGVSYPWDEYSRVRTRLYSSGG